MNLTEVSHCPPFFRLFLCCRDVINNTSPLGKGGKSLGGEENREGLRDGDVPRQKVSKDAVTVCKSLMPQGIGSSAI